MALTSPGVEVSVIDESFYTPAEPGTRPLFIVASAANKQNGSGTGTAQGTVASNSGRVYLITSQRDLVETFGDPTFRVDSNNNPIHAGEQNEFGLQAAYSYLGVSNSALVVRADLDLAALDPQADPPGGAPKDGTFWLNTSASTWGIFQWDNRPATDPAGQSFNSRTPTIILDSTKLEDGIPKSSEGSTGDYAIAPGTANDEKHLLKLFYKSRFAEDGSVGQASWVQVGSDGWAAAWPTVQGNAPSTGPYNGSFTITVTYSDETVGSSSITASSSTFDQIVSLISDASIAGVDARKVDGLLEIFVTDASIKRVEISNSALAPAVGLTPGVYLPPKFQASPHTDVPRFKIKDNTETKGVSTGAVWMKTTEPNRGARLRLNRYNGETQLWEAVEAPIYASSSRALAAMDPNGGGLNLTLKAAYLQFNYNESVSPLAEFRVMRRRATGPTVIYSKEFAAGGSTGAFKFNMTESLVGKNELGETPNGQASTKTISVTLAGTAADAEAIAAAINSPGLDIGGNSQTPFVNIVASVDGARNRVEIRHKTGGEIRFADLGDSTNFVATILDLDNNVNVYAAGEGDNAHEFVASNWIPLTITPDTANVVRQSYYIANDAPETLVADGALWYSSVIDEVDIMVHNGSIWAGYRNFDHGDGPAATDAFGPIVSASEPTERPDGEPAFVTGDLWIDTSDLENYPLIKRYNRDLGIWDTLDTSDQTTENGVLFADARAGKNGGTPNEAPTGTIRELLTSNYVDFDAPDPALYPRGMILFNLRRSGFNVKRFERNYVDTTADNIRYSDDPGMNDAGNKPTNGGDPMTNYYPHRWVTESGNQANGAGSFGRKAQRKVVIQALQALVNSNQDIRDTERNGFNLLACPGYPELIGEMISLNFDRGLTAFIVGDTPARLRPDATTINEWGTNVALALQDDDTGLVSSDEYLGVFYPCGFTSDNAGRDIAVPPSHMILRMMALNDQVAYPWFAPAGTRRGGITNATAVGYISEEGEFVSVALNEGQRDTLYNVKVNPITFFVGAGLVNFGQKTRARNASALDRINVARLVIYLRSQLNKLAKPYIFEPNDKITRDEIKQQVESLLLELVGLRALYDFLVVCDESNNTPNRIDRNELYVDIAIEPVKAVEFIYIPVRLKNTGEIAGL